MAEINFALLNPVDTGAQVQQGFATGMAMVKQVQTRNALRAYLANPDDPQAFNALALYDPGAASSIQNQRLLQLKLNKETRDEALTRDIGTRAAAGDVAGARTAAISAGNFDLATHLEKLDDDQRSKLAAFYKAAGPVAYQMRQTTDPAQRKALLDSARPMLEATGVDPKLIDGFDVTNDTALDGLIAANSTVDQLIDRGKITWHQQGDQPSFATDSMGRPIGSQNPYRQGESQPSSGPTASSGGARGDRNNNPLNLTKSDFTTSQPGYAGTDSGGRYAKFETPEAGMTAAGNLLHSYLQRGFDTPAEIIGRWAPAGENGATATANYTNFIAGRLGIAPGDKISPAQIPALAQAMSDWENGRHGSGGNGPLPVAITKADFDALPSGAEFVAPDGSHRKKP